MMCMLELQKPQEKLLKTNAAIRFKKMCSQPFNAQIYPYYS